ncbi:MAG: MBL fold metallo-hydrolase [Oscillospiraceae bacterium]
MKICTLKSSSRGNAILVYTDTTKILVDCGVSGKALELGLKDAGVLASDIDAMVITHEHIDHIKGVGVMMRRYGLSTYANHGTWLSMSDSLGKINDKNIKVFNNSDSFEIGDIGIKPFSIPHDATDPVGYSFVKGTEKLSIATDIGELTPEMFESLRGSRAVLLEANHDVNMLEIGSYPFPLKRRIRGSLGHLSNDEAGEAAKLLTHLGTRNIILGHLSEENNYPRLAFQTVKNILEENNIHVGKDIELTVADACQTGCAI